MYLLASCCMLPMAHSLLFGTEPPSRSSCCLLLMARTQSPLFAAATTAAGFHVVHSSSLSSSMHGALCCAVWCHRSHKQCLVHCIHKSFSNDLGSSVYFCRWQQQAMGLSHGQLVNNAGTSVNMPLSSHQSYVPGNNGKQSFEQLVPSVAPSQAPQTCVQPDMPT